MVTIQCLVHKPLTHNMKKKLTHCHWLPQTHDESSATSPHHCHNKGAWSVLHLNEQKFGYNLMLFPTCKHHANCLAFVMWHCYANPTPNTKWSSISSNPIYPSKKKQIEKYKNKYKIVFLFLHGWIHQNHPPESYFWYECVHIWMKACNIIHMWLHQSNVVVILSFLEIWKQKELIPWGTTW